MTHQVPTRMAQPLFCCTHPPPHDLPASNFLCNGGMLHGRAPPPSSSLPSSAGSPTRDKAVAQPLGSAFVPPCSQDLSRHRRPAAVQRIQGAQRCRDPSCCLLLRLLALGPEELVVVIRAAAAAAEGQAL